MKYNKEIANLAELGDRLAINTPFNAEFKDQLKALIPSAKWDGTSRVWTVTGDARPQVEQLLSQFYPPQENLQLVRIEWDLTRDNPTIDGVSLASVSRDWWNWRKDCPVQFKVIEQDLESGGSRKSPGLYGRLVIETKIRPDADICPSVENFEVIEEGEEVNPLKDFSDEQLLAELKRRKLI